MPGKILIAHGNTQQLKRAVTDLRARGFEVAATPDGGDAFARFFEELPDIVLCSAGLPGLSGVSFARMVRSQSPGTPVVILEDAPTGADPGEFVVLSDPLDVEALCRAFPALAPQALTPSSGDDLAAALTTADVFTLAALKKFQRGSNPLSLLDDEGLTRLARLARAQVRSEGEQIIRQGDPGDGFYLVVEGSVRVTLREQGDVEVARIGEGGFFGEMAILSAQPRSASVWSVGTATLLFFEREEFVQVLEDYPSLKELIGGVALARTEENLWSVLFRDAEVQESLAELEAEHVPPTGLAETEAEVGAEVVAEVAAHLFDNLAAEAPSEQVRAQAQHAVPDDATEPVAITPSADAGRGLPAEDVTQPDGASAAPSPVAPAPAPGLFERRLSVPLVPFAAAALGVFCAGVLLGMELAPSADATSSRELSAAVVEVATVPAVAAPSDEVAPSDAAPAQAASPGDADAATAGAASPDAVEPAQAAAPVAVAEPAVIAAPPAPPPDRKQLRNDLFARYRAKEYGGAVEAGQALRAAFPDLDWEADFVLAQAERTANRLEEALASYLAFAKKYPTNSKADDAEFWAAEILTGQGKHDEARALYEKVRDTPKSDFHNSAAQRLGGR